MAADTLVPKDELERWENSLDRKKQIILYGPPGTGKTFLAQRLANHVVGGTDGFPELVQFHLRKEGGQYYLVIKWLDLTSPRTTGNRAGLCARSRA
jgi:SpoVK/Ycf46/Vps4 family AAA+-type ATPase